MGSSMSLVLIAGAVLLSTSSSCRFEGEMWTVSLLGRSFVTVVLCRLGRGTSFSNAISVSFDWTTIRLGKEAFDGIEVESCSL